jgi:proline iminopeptidase
MRPGAKPPNVSVLLPLLLFGRAAIAAPVPATPATSAATGTAIARSDGYVNGCGAIIYYESIGTGRPLIVLHGGPGASHQYFLPHLLPLARKHRLVFIDERGSGRSQRLVDVHAYTLETMSCDVDAVRRALGFESTDVLGHSFGGILAQDYAIRYAPHVRRLILAGTGSSAERLNADFTAIKAALAPELRTKIEAFEAGGILGQDGAQKPEYRKLADEAELPYEYAVRPPAWSEPADPIGWDVLNTMWGGKSDFHIDGNLRGFDFVPNLRKLTTPTLIIAGDHDLASRTTLEQTHAALKQSHLVVLEHCGHESYVDQPLAFFAAVTSFLGD